ncbi:MAG TPA: TonB family protein, partial [Ramlibacter sp.]|nr:TonB family protein [Ramlibacter sp.]
MPAQAVNPAHRNLLIAGSVVVFHVAVLWALQSGLLRRTVEMVVPAVLLSEFVAPPAPKVEEPAPVAAPEPAPPKPVKQPQKTLPVAKASPEPAPQPLAAQPSPQPPAPSMASQAQPSAPSPVATMSAAPAAPARELPTSDADYLQNPRPMYPAMSKRLNEQGRVIVRVLIGEDGRPQNPQVKVSSGFDRLDRAAIEHVMRCRFVPG